MSCASRLLLSLVLALASPLYADSILEGKAAFAKGDYPAAAEAFRSALSTNGPSAGLYYNLATAEQKSGRRAEAAVSKQKEQASQARLQTAISLGSTLLGAILGRKTLSSATLSKAATTARGVGRTIQEGSEAATAEQTAEAIRRQIAEMETEVEAEGAALAATEPTIEVVEVKPARSGVSVRLLALGWIPQTA